MGKGTVMFGKKLTEDDWPLRDAPTPSRNQRRDDPFGDTPPRLADLRPAADREFDAPPPPLPPEPAPVMRERRSSPPPAQRAPQPERGVSLALPAPRTEIGMRGSSPSALGRGGAHPDYQLVFETIFNTIELEQLEQMGARRAREEIRDLVEEVDASRSLGLDLDAQDSIATAIGDDLVGLGPLEALVARGDVEEIRVTAPEVIHVEVNGKRRRAALQFRDQAQLAAVCRRLAARGGMSLNAQTPMCDGRLPDGARVTVVLPPAAATPLVRIRRPAHCGERLETLVHAGGMSPETAEILSLAVRARCNVLVAGPAGRAQTGLASARMLSALAHEIDISEAVAIVEDVRRMTSPHPQALRLTAEGGLGAASMRRRAALVRAAVRLGSDRLIVDPLDGPEAQDVLQAMAGGHRGSLASLTAVDARAALARLEMLAAAGGHPETARALIAGAVDLIVQLDTDADDRPRVTRVSEVAVYKDGQLTPRDVLAPVAEDGAEPAPLKFVAHGRPGFWTRVAGSVLEPDFVRALRAVR